MIETIADTYLAVVDTFLFVLANVYLVSLAAGGEGVGPLPGPWKTISGLLASLALGLFGADIVLKSFGIENTVWPMVAGVFVAAVTFLIFFIIANLIDDEVSPPPPWVFGSLFLAPMALGLFVGDIVLKRFGIGNTIWPMVAGVFVATVIFFLFAFIRGMAQEGDYEAS